MLDDKRAAGGGVAGTFSLGKLDQPVVSFNTSAILMHANGAVRTSKTSLKNMTICTRRIFCVDYESVV